jgi:hypothetical protein
VSSARQYAAATTISKATVHRRSVSEKPRINPSHSAAPGGSEAVFLSRLAESQLTLTYRVGIPRTVSPPSQTRKAFSSSRKGKDGIRSPSPPPSTDRLHPHSGPSGGEGGNPSPPPRGPPGPPNPPPGGPPGGPNPPGPRSRISLSCALCSSVKIFASLASTSF